ncbi:T9SS type A sorting domain-containing protein [candidate division KSB1 bacterium]|nr:T9SS type A sorting domain-containing protein [candidate division KSB1 bacterium]
MKNICFTVITSFLFALFLSIATKAQHGWFYLDPLPTENALLSVHFVNADTGYVVGGHHDGQTWIGIITKTMNGGITWIIQTTQMGLFWSVYFTDENTGYAVGGIGTILKTTDGGDNWILQNSGTTSSLYSVFFVNVDTGYVVGSGGTILRTTDSGNNWIAQNSGTTRELRSIFFPIDSIGYAVGGDGTIMKTIDGGNNWNINPPSITNTYLSVYFTNQDTGFIVGNNFTGGRVMLKTTNGGNNWSGIPIYTSTDLDDLQSVYFTDTDTGYSVGSNGMIIKTTDGGNYWLIQNFGTTESLRSVYFTDANIGYAVGCQGVILKTINGGVLSVDKIPNDNISKKLELWQNYPNPANSTTMIEYTLPKTFKVVLKIHNLLGEEIKTLVDDVQTPGLKSVMWNGKDNFGRIVSSGIYFYILQAGNERQVRKMLFLK